MASRPESSSYSLLHRPLSGRWSSSECCNAQCKRRARRYEGYQFFRPVTRDSTVDDFALDLPLYHANWVLFDFPSAPIVHIKQLDSLRIVRGSNLDGASSIIAIDGLQCFDSVTMGKAYSTGWLPHDFVEGLVQDNIAELPVTVVYCRARSSFSWYDANQLADQFFHRMDGVAILSKSSTHPSLRSQFMKETSFHWTLRLPIFRWRCRLPR